MNLEGTSIPSLFGLECAIAVSSKKDFQDYALNRKELPDLPVDLSLFFVVLTGTLRGQSLL